MNWTGIVLVGGTDLRIRRTERTHELRRLITASKAKGSIRSAPILAFTCMRGRKNDATYFAQKHKIGGQKLEMKYTESDKSPARMDFKTLQKRYRVSPEADHLFYR